LGDEVARPVDCPPALHTFALVTSAQLAGCGSGRVADLS
jgi:hypothetical protein